MKTSLRGNTIIEMLVAISIVIISLLGIIYLLNYSLGLNKVIAEQYAATYLAAEGIELVKNLFDRQFLAADSGSQNFYGWTVGASGANGPPCTAPVTPCSLAPSSGNYEIFEMGYDDTSLVSVNCALDSDEPTQSNLRKLFFDGECNFIRPLHINADGIYSYNPSDPKTKFRRVIVIDKPPEYSGVATNLDYRVTSAVSWSSRGGLYVIHLQDHFLPWKTP